MKKVYLRTLALSAIILGAASCSKETQTALEPGMATITGKVWANTNLVNDSATAVSAGLIDSFELAPAGTQITFVIKGEELDPNPQAGYPYKDIIKTATVGADGMYTVSVPAYEKGVNVDIKFDDFMADQTIEDQTVTPNRTATKKMKFMAGDQSVMVVAGMKKVVNVRYSN
jgi:hypothetical protein